MKYTCALLALNSLLVVGLQPQAATATILYSGSGFPEAELWLVPGAINSSGFPIDPVPNRSFDPVTNAVIVQTENIDSTSSTAGYFGYTNQIPNPASIPSGLSLFRIC